MNKLSIALAVAGSLALSGCSSEPQLTKAQLSAKLVEASEVSADADAGIKAGFQDFVFAKGWADHSNCATSVQLFKSVSGLPIVAQKDIGIASDMTLGFHEWILDAGSTSAAEKIVSDLSAGFFDEACSLNSWDSSNDLSLEKALGRKFPGHLWIRSATANVNDLTVTFSGHYILFTYATGRSTDFGASKFSSVDAGSATGAALSAFEGK